MPGRRATGGSQPLALATADTEAHVIAVALGSGRVVRRLATVDDPRSIQSGPGGHVVVAHSAVGAVSVLTAPPVRVRRASLPRGTLTVLDRAGRVRREVDIARSAHDACIVS